MSLLDRVEAAQKSAVPSRLLRGAEVLGRLWREKMRCGVGWAVGCACGQLATEFCVAKGRWATLYQDLHGDEAAWLTPDRLFGILEAMTVRQFEASGITAQIELPGAIVPLLVGPKGICWKTVSDLGAIEDNVDRQIALDAAMRFQGGGF